MNIPKQANTKEGHFSKSPYIILLLWMLFHLPCYSQNSSAVKDPVAEQLESLSKDNVADVVYLQTSKSIYETDEDVWFKGYVLDAQYFVPSERSKTLFVQLIEEKTDQVVWEKKYEIENGFVNGHLFLQDSLPEGTYNLAAYSSSSYTKNTNEFYAIKKLEILKSINLKAIAKPVEKDSTLHFTTFPEGGHLVSGIESTLAFKAINSKSLPMDISGTLFENDKPLLDFKSSHAGMGSFVFTPDADKKYHIQLTKPALRQKFFLGEIYHSGKALQLLNSTKDTLTFKISQSATLKEETIYLRLQLRGLAYIIARGLLKEKLIIKIPLKDIPQGIAEVTLFDANAVPIAERLVYVNHEQKLTIKAELSKSDLSTREKLNLKIKVTDPNGMPVVAHLGLSVYDRLYHNKKDSKNIESHYYLSTQLKGNIYNPAYYFNEQHKDRQQALNSLLLTQGWRNYVWSETNLKELGNSHPVVFDEIKGKIRLEKPAKKATAVLGQKGIMVFAADELKGKDLIATDSMGVFTISPSHLKKGEGSYTYLKLMTPNDPKYLMQIKDSSFDEINKERKIKTSLYPFPELKEEKLEVSPPFSERQAINKLKEVLITSKKKIVFRDKYIGKLDSLARKLHVSNDYVGEPCKILNCPIHPTNTNKPIQGKKYDEYVGFKWLSEDRSAYTFSGMNKNVIYKYPDLTEAELLALFNIAMIKGYYGKKVFYETVYDEVTINDSSPDYRNTLFWKPDIITNEQGEATIDLFCSDINTTFLGNIEGVSGDGLLGAENFEFKVRKK